MIENITAPQPYLKIYPAPEEVFAEPVELYARHLMPFVSIDLAVVNPDWQGWIHMVNTVEPYDGSVGQDTHEFHNYYLRENWIGFHLNDQGRYELLGDFRYFELEYIKNPPTPLSKLDLRRSQNQAQALEEYYATQHASLAAAKERFTRSGVFHSQNFVRYNPDCDLSQKEPSTLIRQLGGGVEAGNWDYGFPFDEIDEENIRPLAPDGTPFHFIASVRGWDYCASGADEILLFYERNSKIALLTFDWS
ncbi:MAG TPA: hypothetical protein VGB77_20900 [Abditibacteriaceae bacterium]|jgi:hypothetical protein